MKKPSKNTFFGIVFLIIIVGLGVFAVSQDTDNNSGREGVSTSTPLISAEERGSVPKAQIEDASGQEEELSVVVYTEDGFRPPTAVIRRGQRIIFINQSNDNMQIESDSYSDLNQKQVVSRGGTHDVTFHEIGQWSYYNEENPDHEGTIYVN